MKQKDIENAAIEFVSGALNSYYAEIQEEGFIAGAKWRINSLWHDKSEEPQVFGEYAKKHYPQIPCLVQGQISTGYGYGVRYWNVTEKCWDDEECDDYECGMEAIDKWAYLDDLLPNEDYE